MELKSLVGIGAIAVGGYLLYNWFYSTPVAAASATGDSRILGTTLHNQMLVASGANDTTEMNADNWSYYWNAINGPHGGALTAEAFTALFITPFGGDRSKLYTIDEYLAALSTKGLSGFGKALGNIGLSTRPVIKLTATAYERSIKN